MSIAERDVTDHPDREGDPISEFEEEFEPGDGDTRRRLVVVGNGMAGARTVEEILARGGAEQFSITMFGDEPYGNYNRIMLSHVLSGEETDADIFLNSLPWYLENDITLHAGVRATRVDRFAKLIYSDDGRVTPYDVLIMATGSRSFMPAIIALRGRLLSRALSSWGDEMQPRRRRERRGSR